VVPGMELLEVLPAFGFRACEGDLDQLAHLRRPATERLDELAEREATGRLRPKAMLVEGLHGPVY
jgi:hypothetical protein